MKRIVIAALAALPGAALAQQPGEVALQVSATGTVQRPADEATETVSLAGTGDTREAAKAALETKLSAFRGALTAAGISAGAVVVTDEMVMPDMQIPIVRGVPPTPPAKLPFRASLDVRLKLSDPAKFAQVTDIVHSQGLVTMGQPQYGLKNDQMARTAAAADALRQARTNAEQYAAAMKMRIVRVTRVADYGQNIDISQFTDFATIFDPAKRGSTDVTVRVRVWVDFVMAPL